MGALTAASVVILSEGNLERPTIQESRPGPAEIGFGDGAEKSMRRIENDDCTWAGVSG